MVKKSLALKKAARVEAEAAETKEAPASAAGADGEAPPQDKKKRKAIPAKVRRDNKKKRKVEKKEQANKERDENNAVEDAEHLDKRLVVANLPTTVTRQELQGLFERFGTIHRARLFVNSKGVFRGVGFVTFENEAEFQEALKVSSMEFKKQTLKVQKAEPPQTKAETSVFVGGLPFTAEEAKIRKHFKSCGDIKDVRMQEDRVRKRFNGIAFIQFKTEVAAQAALKLDRSAFGGRSLLVKLANPKKKPLAKHDRAEAAADDGVAKHKAADAAEDAPAQKKAKKAADVAEDAPEKNKTEKAVDVGEAAPEKKKKKKQKAVAA